MKVAKEIFIMALLIMIVVFMVGLVFYEYMPNNKVVPEAITYAADSSTTAILQEISSTSASKDDENDDDTSGVADIPLKSYSIGQQELSTAASKKAYTSGKTDPFAEYFEPDPNSVNNTTGNTTVANPSGGNTTSSGGTKSSQGSSSNNGGSNNNGGNKGGSSTGSFFEKPNSK